MLEQEETIREESFQIYQLTRICHDLSNAARLSMGAVCELEGCYPRRDLNVVQLEDSLGAEHQEVAAAAFEATGDEASHARLADEIAWGGSESGMVRSHLWELGLAVRR